MELVSAAPVSSVLENSHWRVLRVYVVLHLVNLKTACCSYFPVSLNRVDTAFFIVVITLYVSHSAMSDSL